jgi:hypothetical protein
MGANADSMPDRQLDATTHSLGIAGVKAAGDACRTDQRKDLFVWCCAVDSKAFSEVTVNIHAAHGIHLFPKR